MIGLIQRSEIDKRYLSFQTAPLTSVEHHALVKLPGLDAADRLPGPARAAPGGHRRRDRPHPHPADRSRATTSSRAPTRPASRRARATIPATAFPGLGQTVAIAGHRTTYLAPFRHLDALKPGDRIVLKMPYAVFTYAVQYRRIVLPTALWVTTRRRLRAARAVGLQSALQRGPADHHLRAAEVGDAGGARAPGVIDLGRLRRHPWGRFRRASMPGGSAATAPNKEWRTAAEAGVADN